MATPANLVATSGFSKAKRLVENESSGLKIRNCGALIPDLRGIPVTIGMCRC